MIRVGPEDFDPGRELAALEADGGEAGALVSFLGTVRVRSEGAPILSLTIEHYPGMTERALAAMEREATRRFGLTGSLILHRVGRLKPGARIVLVGVRAPHRAAAFEACAFLTDFLKSRAPFWKKEETPGGARWVGAKASDEAALARWERGA
ncbi:MAG: molybdenum cofactor biosynthesis protein MoaE [Alphaproteobacteria bacterium]|nr:molybdenum cofactor biosynthesis protein MoaE [Alphaproteobacteria bacterium]